MDAESNPYDAPQTADPPPVAARSIRFLVYGWMLLLVIIVSPVLSIGYLWAQTSSRTPLTVGDVAGVLAGLAMVDLTLGYAAFSYFQKHKRVNEFVNAK